MCMNKQYASIDELPAELRLFPLSGALLLPRGDLPLNIFEPRYIAMVDTAMATDRLIGMIQPLPGPCSGDPRFTRLAASAASRISTRRATDATSSR